MPWRKEEASIYDPLAKYSVGIGRTVRLSYLFLAKPLLRLREEDLILLLKLGFSFPIRKLPLSACEEMSSCG